jgi:hypothetical protein
LPGEKPKEMKNFAVFGRKWDQKWRRYDAPPSVFPFIRFSLNSR